MREVQVLGDSLRNTRVVARGHEKIRIWRNLSRSLAPPASVEQEAVPRGWIENFWTRLDTGLIAGNSRLLRILVGADRFRARVWLRLLVLNGKIELKLLYGRVR